MAPGTSRVPERTSRSCPPPCSSGVQAASRRSSRAPTPTGPPSLCPVSDRASTPLAAKSTGTAPTACTASVWNGTPNSCATSASARTSLTVPTSLLAHMTLTRATSPGWAASASRRRRDVDPARRVDGQDVEGGALVLGEPLPRVEHRVVLRGRDEHAGAAGVGGAAGPVEALDGEVVGLGAAGGQHDLGRQGADGLGDRLARLLDRPPRPAARRVQGRRIADAPERLGEGGRRLRQHRRGRRVVEIGHRPASVIPSCTIGSPDPFRGRTPWSSGRTGTSVAAGHARPAPEVA